MRDPSDGLEWLNLIYFMRHMEQVYGIETCTHPKEAIEAAQRAANSSREEGHTSAGVRGNGRAVHVAPDA